MSESSMVHPPSGEIWSIESNTRGTKAISFGALIMGALFIWLTSRIPENSTNEKNVLAGFWLGVLLMGVGAFALFFAEKVTLTVDEKRKKLTIVRDGFLGRSVSESDFGGVASVDVASVGRNHRGIPQHYLNLRFKNGRVLRTQRWSFNHSEISDLGGRLAQALECPCRVARNYSPVDFPMIATSAIGAVIVYALWYRYAAGPWCIGMWRGSGPIFIIGAVFFMIFQILRRWRRF